MGFIAWAVIPDGAKENTVLESTWAFAVIPCRRAFMDDCRTRSGALAFSANVKLLVLPTD